MASVKRYIVPNITEHMREIDMIMGSVSNNRAGRVRDPDMNVFKEGVLSSTRGRNSGIGLVEGLAFLKTPSSCLSYLSLFSLATLSILFLSNVLALLSFKKKASSVVMAATIAPIQKIHCLVCISKGCIPDKSSKLTTRVRMWQGMSLQAARHRDP